MLTIKRRTGETIEIDGPCCVVIGKPTSGGIKVHIEAPDSTAIYRGELLAAERMRARRIETVEGQTAADQLAELQKDRDQLLAAWVTLKGLVMHTGTVRDPVACHMIGLMEEAFAAAGLETGYE